MRSTFIRRTSTALTSLALLACTEPPAPGSLSITTTAAMAEPLFFQYAIAVDGGTPRVLQSGQPDLWIINGLAAGQHVVTLTGDVPPACNSGPRERRISLEGNDTVDVRFDFICGRITGDVRVSVTTTGTPSSAFFFVIVDGVIRGTVSTNGAATVQFVSVGSRLLSLVVPPNCSAPGAQPASVTVGALAAVSFAVNCTPLAVLRVTSAITGTDVDPDRFTLRLDGGSATRLTAVPLLRQVPAGTYNYEIGDVQPNCTTSMPTTGSITLGGGDTVTLAASASCAAIPGGVAGFTATDPADDTLAVITTTAPRAHDIRSLTGRYAPGWLILILRFAQPVSSTSSATPATRLSGALDLDIDESALTGAAPLVNNFGGTAVQGVDFSVSLFDSDEHSSPLAAIGGGSHRVLTRHAGDSLIIYLPLNKLGDEGNMTISAALGTEDRPTDLVPNAGVVQARLPASVIAGDYGRTAVLVPESARAGRPLAAPPGWPRRR